MNEIKEAHYNLGIAYLEAGQYSRAVPEFESAIKLDPNFIGAHCALCRAYLQEDELENAGIAITAALKLDANHQPALLLRGMITDAYYDRGKTYLDDRSYTEAVTAFQKAIALDADLRDSSQDVESEKTHIHVHLGAAYIGMKSYPQAIEALERALTQDADLVDAHYHLGYAYVEQGEHDKAIPHLERAIAIAPHLKRAHYHLARAYRALGNLEAATNAVTETLRLDPNYQSAQELADTIKQAHYNRGITYLNSERYSEAATAFQNAITLDPDFATAHYNLGLAYLQMEAYRRALPSLEKTIVLDPNHKAAYHALALAYLGQQELGKARGAARDALKLDPNYQPVRSLLEAIDPSYTPIETDNTTSSKLKQDADPHPPKPEPAKQTTPSTDTPDAKQDLERGLAFLNSRQYDQAAAAFKRAIKADPNSMEAHYGLGQAYLELGAYDDAKTAAQAALKLNPNSPKARELIQVIAFARNIEKNKRIRKKVLSYAAIVGIIAVIAFVAIRLNLIPWSTTSVPPILSITVSLEEPSRNGFLDAGETGRIKLTITNKGGAARNVEVKFEPLAPKSIAGLRFEKSAPISKLSENSEETIRISIKADKNVKGRNQKLLIQLFGKTSLFAKKEILATKEFSFNIIPKLQKPAPRRGGQQ